MFDLAQPAKPALVKSIDVGKMAFDPVFTPDGKFVWVPVKSTNEIVVIDATTAGQRSRASRTQPSSSRTRSCSRADGATAFVTNNNKMDHMADPAHAGHADARRGDGTASLVVIDVKTRQVEKAIPLGKNLTGHGHPAGDYTARSARRQFVDERPRAS